MSRDAPIQNAIIAFDPKHKTQTKQIVSPFVKSFHVPKPNRQHITSETVRHVDELTNLPRINKFTKFPIPKIPKTST